MPFLDSAASRLRELAKKFRKRDFRAAYVETHLKGFLATQIRALRGEDNQTMFGKKIGKPQSVVSRLEDESYGTVNLQTLIDIAKKLDIALVVRFVDHPTFIRMTADYSPTALAPLPYTEVAEELENWAERKPTPAITLDTTFSSAPHLEMTFALGPDGSFTLINPTNVANALTAQAPPTQPALTVQGNDDVRSQRLQSDPASAPHLSAALQG